MKVWILQCQQVTVVVFCLEDVWSDAQSRIQIQVHDKRRKVFLLSK